MTILFAIPLVIGIVCLVAWIAAAALAASRSASFDPDARFGAPGRIGVAALVGFGMGGMSGLFAGWSDAAAIGAAVAGAVVLALVARVLAPVGQS